MLRKFVSASILLFGISGVAMQAAGKTPPGSNEIAQAKDVCTGTIMDETGQPTIGASVSVKGAKKGVITDLNGRFSLPGVKPGSVVRVSFVGYEPQEIVWNGQPVNIKLKANDQSLNELVVVGYATVKKENLTGAVSAVDDKVLADRPIVNLGQGLQGTIPNLNITTSGRPGDGASFNIRGTTSINGGSPLVLVDGVQMDPNLVNPSDIQSVSVLKDAASASIYGARAAYGVILITTKTGRTEMPTQVSMDASISFNSPTVRPKYINSMDYANWMNAASRNTNGQDYFDEETMQHIEAYFKDPAHNQPVFIHSNPGQSSNGLKYTYCGNTDWMKAMYKNNYPLQKYNLNIRGGGKKATYYTSAGYMDQGSLLRYGNEQYRKFNLVNNINYDVNNWLHLSMKTSYIRTEKTGLNQTSVSGDNWIGGDTRPLMPVKHPDGHWSGQGNFTNFAAVLEDGGSRKTTNNDFWNTVAVKLTPLKGMTINMDYTFNYYASHSKIHAKSFNEYGANGVFLQSFQWMTPNFVTESQYNDTYNAFNLFGDYEKTLGKHYFKVMAGFNQESKHTRYFYARRNNLISNNLPSMDAASGDKFVSNSDDSWATRSGFFRVNYSFANRYLLELNGRYDLSSKFPKDDRAVFNPSFSAAWRLSEENWFKELTNNFFNDLKFRGSYGSLGNQALDNGWHIYLSTYGAGQMSYIMGGNQAQYVYPGGLVSSSVTWETVTQWNIGLDFTILKNRLTGTFDYYQRKTEGMLAPGKTLPGILGASEPSENAADLVTKGWELSLTWNDRLANGLHYSIGFNLSDAQAEITKFDNPTKDLGNYYVGEKIGEIWGYQTIGLFQSEEEIAKAPDQSKVNGSIKMIPGDIHFADLNGDGVIDYGDNTVDNPGDRKIIGNSTARYRYGFNISADWKGFDLGVFFQGVGKRDLVLPGKLFTAQYGSEWSVPSAQGVDYWREDNRDAYFPVARFNGGTAIGQTQTRYLQDASYLRLKSLTFGYALPVELTKKVGLQKCRFFFTGENLLTFKHTLDGFDPELDNPYGYPLQKSLSIGVNLVF